MSSTSFREDLGAYAASRLAVGRIGLLWGALSVCSLCVSRAPSWVSGCFGSLISAALIVQLRLWDDLIDRARDAHLDPPRTLAVTAHALAFARLCAGLALPVGLSLLAGYGLAKLAAYGALLAAMAAVYSARREAPLARAHAVLLKYPALVWLSARDPDPARWARLGSAAYLALCIYEIVSTEILRRRAAGRWLLAVETLALIAVLFLDWRTPTCRH